jgi:transposase
VIKDIQKRYLGRKFSKPNLRHLRCIAIDEIALGRGYQFVTVVLDLASGAVVFVGEGKNVRALEPFFKRVSKSRAHIEAVAIDMSNAYIEAVRRYLPQAVIVFDHFHVIKLYNDKLTLFRRDLYRKATDLLKKKVLKGTRWLLVKNPENLEDRRNERQRLAEALALNEPLATAYYMKEDLRLLWKQPDKPSAKAFLEDWISRAQTSGIRMLKDAAKTFEFFKRGLLAWYDYPISTGPLEATNNKIKTLQRQAYGFRDREFFTLKIYALHLTKYALVG